MDQYESLERGQYPGGKNAEGTFHQIIDLMPEHWHYAEPFAGSSAIFRRKPVVAHNYLIDADSKVCDFLRRTLIATVIHGDGIRWLRENAKKFNRDWVIYIDPPYLPQTRTKKSIYRYELHPERHIDLLDVATTLEANVLISGYYSELYAERLAKWNSISFPAQTRGGMREEFVWFNFDPKRSPMLTRPYAGGNFRERERVKKKLRRHVANFVRMPEWERQALLSALIEANRSG